MSKCIEDLQNADTLKKRTKRLKIGVLVTIIIIIFGTIGVLEYKSNRASTDNYLSLNTIISTFNKGGLILKEDKLKSPEDFALNEIKPAIFNIGDRKDTLLIYIFKSFLERDEILRQTDKFNNPFSIEQIPFKAKNALIVYIPYELPKTEEEYAPINKLISSISYTVFKQLNDGKEKVYKGESANWEGTFTFKYYEYWLQDEKAIHYDSYSWTFPEIKYKMPDINAVGPITFEYKAGSESGKSTGIMLNEDGHADLGSGGGTGPIPRENEEVSFTIKWEDKEEHIVLKPQ